MTAITYRQLQNILKDASDARLDQPITIAIIDNDGTETFTINELSFGPSDTSPGGIFTLAHNYIQPWQRPPADCTIADDTDNYDYPQDWPHTLKNAPEV
jgi:hypothetical protein